MKNYFIALTTLLILVFSITSCENKKKDKLFTSLSNINQYLIEKDSLSNGKFFEYMNANPNCTYEDIVEKGFIEKNYLLKQIETARNEINKRSGKEVFEIAKKALHPDFIDNGNETNLKKKPKFKIKIKIFKCRGCLDGEKKNHCITLLFWDMGPKC